jgi:type II secretory pathway component GspD/PulD (secretin)
VALSVGSSLAAQEQPVPPEEAARLRDNAALQPAPDAPVPPDSFRFGPFAEGVDLRLLLELILGEMKLPFTITDQAVLSNKVFQPYAITVARDQLLLFIASLLEQKGMTISQGVGGVYVISPAAEVVGRLGDDPFSTTQIITTSGLRPSSLQPAINVALKSGAAAGAPAAGNIAYLDDLGVILMTDTPRKIDAVRNLVSRLATEQSRQDISRFELSHIAAGVARQRVLELLGRPVSRTGNPIADAQAQAMAAQQAAQQGAAGGVASTLSNIADRLIPDPQSNALIFRGRQDEQDFIKRLLQAVDQPNSLRPKWYPVGSAAAQLAQHGKRQGLGEIVTLPSSRTGAEQANFANQNQVQLQFNQGMQAFGQGLGQSGDTGGPMFVIDPEGRGFMYYGTETQQKRVEQLVDEFRELTSAESIVIELYKLRHGKAEDVADIVLGLIRNQAPAGNSPLLPGAGVNQGVVPGQRLTSPRRDQPTNTPTPRPGLGSEGEGELAAINAGEDVFVLADPANNQIAVKAPKRLQPQFRALIDKLDLRRPQVYIDAKIVAISATDDFRLAFETQLINANGTGGALNTNFGLGTLGATPGNLLTPKTVAGGLGGITAAIIKSEYVPIVITALAKNVDTRLLATPQLLVDDNEEAEVSSLDQRPTTTQSQSGSAGTTLTGFGGFEPAGPKLKVKPQISEGNYLKMEYTIELSSFQGDSQTLGSTVIPPAKLENKIQSKSVTIPSDSTIVVGGLTFTQTDRTVVKVPLLGDIPIVGQLFRDQKDNLSTRTLYVFITPKIMRDPTFADLRLLTQGPQSVMRDSERSGPPAPKPARIELLEIPAPAPKPANAPSASPADASAPTAQPESPKP